MKTFYPLTWREEQLKNATNATMSDGLAIYGHVAQNEQEKARESVANWLKKIGFKKGE